MWDVLLIGTVGAWLCIVAVVGSGLIWWLIAKAVQALARRAGAGVGQ